MAPRLSQSVGRVRVELERAVEARQRLGRAAELAQHIAAVAVGVGEFRVAGERVVEARQRVLHLAHAVQRLADQIVRARLARPERQRAAGEVDALLELAFVAGDHRDVIERVGVLRVVAQHLRIALHGQREIALAVVEQALFEQLGGGRGSVMGASKQALAGCQASLSSPRRRAIQLTWAARSGAGSVLGSDSLACVARDDGLVVCLLQLELGTGRAGP